MSFDVAIVGGGIVGLTLAAEISRLGGKVVVFEARILGWGSTNGSIGVIYPVNPLEYKREVFDFSVAAASMYEDYLAALADEFGPIGWIRPGLLQLAQTPGEVQAIENLSRLYAERGVVCKLVSADAFKESTRSIRGIEDHALFFPTAAHVYATDLVSSLAKAILSRGGEIRIGERVDALEVHSGKCVGVISAKGTESTGATVVCAGAWSNALPGATWPRSAAIKPVRGQAVLLKGNAPALQPPLLYSRALDVVQRPDGCVIVGSTQEDVGFEQNCTSGGIRFLLNEAADLLPWTAELKFVEAWSGLRPSPAHQYPFVDRHPDVSGLYISSGHNRNGVFFAPLCAQLLAPKVLRGVESGIEAFPLPIL